MPANLLRQPNFAALVLLAWLLVALALLLQFWPQTAETLLDTDDAMRLVGMRDWLAGQSWFDLHQARLDPSVGYESHWSRLIDAGLAGFFLLLQVFDASAAERLMRAWWPLLWLLPTIAGMAAVAWRIAGREAATVALLLALMGVPAYQQFTPGRIDHHNVMIALTMLAIAAVVWSDRKRWTAAAAGGLSGLALAIGFECLPYLATAGAGLALRHLFDRNAGRPLRDYGLALAGSAAIAFLVSVAPDHWTRSQCDSIAFNSAAAVICTGLVLALVGRFSHDSALTRCFALAAAGSLGMAVCILLDPRCIRGPFALVDPGIWPVWHDHVRELQPLISVFRVNPLTAAAIVAFPAAAVVAALALARERMLRRDFGFLVAVAVLLVAFATMVGAIRGYSYAMWLGMPLVAAAALRLFAALGLQRLVPRIAVAMLLTPLAVSSGAITVALAKGLADTDSFARPASRHCIQTASYAGLAKLPPGLVVTDVSYGPYLLALTPHAVVAAPYHRAGHGIVLAHRALAAPPDAARGILKQAKADYVMVCGPRPPDGLPEPARGHSLWGRLQTGAAPDWLEPVQGTQPFLVYRIRP
jgi:hypothetical protein